MAGFMDINLGGLQNAIGGMLGASAASSRAIDTFAAITASLSRDQAATEDRMKQIDFQTNEEMGQRTKEAVIQTGKLNAVLAENGVVGNTADALRHEIIADASRDYALIAYNGTQAVRQAQRDFSGRVLQAQSNINQVQRPSGWSSLISVAGGFMAPRNTQTLGDVLGSFKGSSAPIVPSRPSWSSGAGEGYNVEIDR